MVEERSNSNIKDISYYHKIINKNMLVFLILSVVVIAIMFITNVTESSAYLVIRCAMLFVLTIISLVNWKKHKQFIGVYSLIISIAVIIVGAINHSLFDIIFVILGIFNLIYSIKYLKEFYRNDELVKEYKSEKKTVFTWINLVLLASPILIIVLILNYINIESILLIQFMSILISMTIYIFVAANSIYFIINKYRSVLLYIELAISIFMCLILMFLMFVLAIYGLNS